MHGCFKRSVCLYPLLPSVLLPLVLPPLILPPLVLPPWVLTQWLFSVAAFGFATRGFQHCHLWLCQSSLSAGIVCMFTTQCCVAEVQLLRRLKNEEALLQKNKKVGSGDMVKSARAGPRALGHTSGPSKIRRSTNDALSLSALSINPASTSSSSSSNRSVLPEFMLHPISFSSCAVQRLLWHLFLANVVHCFQALFWYNYVYTTRIARCARVL